MSDKTAVQPPESEKGQAVAAAPAAPPAAQAAAQPDNKPKRNKHDKNKRRRKMPVWLKVLIPIIIIGLIITGAYLLIKKLGAKDEEQPMTGIASRGTLSSQVTGWGSVAPKTKAEYGAKTRGEVTEVAVQSGDLVEPGDLLFVVNPKEAQEELDDAIKSMDTAAQNLKTASEAFTKATVTAPFSGKLIKVGENLKVGQSVSGGTVIGTLADDSYMTLALYFNYAYIDVIKVGDGAKVSVPDSMAEVEGTVTSIDRIQKPYQGAMLFRVNVKIKNPGTLTEDQLAAGSVLSSQGELMPADAGKLEYLNKQDVVIEVSGKLNYCDLIEYGSYTQGQKMCSIDSSDLEGPLTTAQNAYDDASKKVTELREELGKTEIRSEIAGQVSAVTIEPGDKLTAGGTPLVTVLDISSLVVEVNIDELDISKVQVGMMVDITFDTSDGQGHTTGEVTYVSFEAKADQNNNGIATFPAKIALSPESTLLPGVSINYSITSVVKEECLMVPSTAVIYTDQGTVVYVKESESYSYDKVELPEGTEVPKGFYPVAVETGLADEQNMEIISGIDEGTEVYMTGMMNQSGGYYSGGAVMIG